jgi:hypothetical protein
VDEIERRVGGSMSTFYGKYRGVVVNNLDPMGRGRIQVQVLNVSETSPWAVPCLPAGGPPQAQFQLPPIGSGVWVEFEGGDPAYPIWAGNMWNEQGVQSPGGMVEETPRPVPSPGLPTTERASARRPKIAWPRQEFPVKVVAPDLNAEPNEVPIEPFEVPNQDDEGPPDD